ncbi:ABC transporter [Leptotrichia wadei]|uniref:ABC transporter n=1 Tax=Leptotrichia wadei TaxID=157687 RepID=A0A510KAW4_9FUSO|nr:ABC transporter [Leptotrichia wadei]
MKSEKIAKDRKNMEEKKIVEVKKLKKQYGDNIILKNINLHINKGEVVSLIGPSGSGKSTILRCIVDLESITSGEILIEGNNLTDKNVDKKIKKEMLLKTGMVFQTFNLFPHMSVRNNIVRTLKLVKKMDTEKAENIAKEMLNLVGLSDKINNYPNELSGGQKQRVAIARALALHPDIMLFDEPTSALDPELVKEVLDIIRKLKSQKITMLIVSHEMNFVREISDRVIVIEKGEILETGTAQQIFENPSSQRVREFLNANK